jgi:hypothetical protein
MDKKNQEREELLKMVKVSMDKRKKRIEEMEKSLREMYKEHTTAVYRGPNSGLEGR